VLSQTIARIGTANEAYTRIKTFEHVLKSLVEEASPGAYKEMKKMGFADAYQQGIYSDLVDKAAQIVEDTFFDYSKVTMFEKAVAKRTIPYWTFHTRNAHFWMKTLTDPKMVSRVIKNARTYKSIGREPTKEERQFIPSYVLKEGARVLPGKSDDGRTLVVTFPGASFLDALSDTGGLAAIAGKITGAWPEGVSADRIKATEKMSPVLKPLVEMALGKELFTGKKLLPSESDGGNRRVFSDALATKWIFDYPLSFVPYKTKIYVDDRGRDYFITDDTDARIITLRRNWLPLRFLEKLMGYRKDTTSLFGEEPKRTPLEAGIHYWTPFSVRPYTNEQQIKGIKRTLRKKRRERTIKSRMQEFNLESIK